MKLEDIRIGMTFRENDSRALGRVVTITRVDYKEGVIHLNSRTKSRKPERFHKEKRSSGYTLVSSPDIESDGGSGSQA